MSSGEDRELVPLKADFDLVWRGYRRSQVQFYIHQTENEVRMLAEDRDSALSQVTDLTTKLEEARSEIEDLRQRYDQVCRSPVDDAGLPDRLRRMVRLAQDEAEEVVSSARAAAEHEWARAQEAATELRARYQRLVQEADEWRVQAETQRNESLEQTRQDIERMAREAEEHRRSLDRAAEQRRLEIEEDFEISMAARREESMRVLAERDRASREEAERRVREATAEAERRIRRADEHVEAMRRLREATGKQVQAAQELLQQAEPFLAASLVPTENGDTDSYVATVLHGAPESGQQEVTVPKQRAVEDRQESAATSGS